jgi:aminoglycoside 3-N-acetyltransferase
MSQIKWIASLLPSPIYSAAKRVQRYFRHRQWERTVADNKNAVFDCETLAMNLRALGVQPGRDLIVHSAMSRLGFVEGGAEAVINAIRTGVGPEATILMPCYPMKLGMLDTMKDPTPFEIAKEESTMGKITRIFRVMPGTLRSAHPTHSVAANGPRAQDYTAYHHLSRSPCGPRSPFQILSQNDGYILCIGSGVGKVTNHHNIEDLVDNFPLDVYLPEPFIKRVIFPDGSELDVEVLVHDPALGPIRVDNSKTKEYEVLERMRKHGIIKEGKVGLADCHLFRAVDLDNMHREGLARGLTIYAR